MSYRICTFVVAAAAALTAALATLPEVHAKGGGRAMGGKTSLITTTTGGTGVNKPTVRDHRNPRLQTERCKGGGNPRNPYCRDNPNSRPHPKPR